MDGQMIVLFKNKLMPLLMMPLQRARNQMTQGESAEFCDECGEAIPLARQKAIRGVRYCINCQEAIDKNIIPLVAIIAVVVKIANSDNEHTSYTKKTVPYVSLLNQGTVYFIQSTHELNFADFLST